MCTGCATCSLFASAFLYESLSASSFSIKLLSVPALWDFTTSRLVPEYTPACQCTSVSVLCGHNRKVQLSAEGSVLLQLCWCFPDAYNTNQHVYLISLQPDDASFDSMSRRCFCGALSGKQQQPDLIEDTLDPSFQGRNPFRWTLSLLSYSPCYGCSVVFGSTTSKW